MSASVAIVITSPEGSAGLRVALLLHDRRLDAEVLNVSRILRERSTHAIASSRFSRSARTAAAGPAFPGEARQTAELLPQALDDDLLRVDSTLNGTRSFSIGARR